MESIGIATFLCENPNKTEYKKTGQNLETGTNPEESQKIKQVFFFFKSYERQQKVRNMVSQ